MKKGIAIQTILLMLVGMLVIGLIVYLVYRQSTGESVLTTTECRSSLTDMCRTCMLSEWSSSVSIPASLRECSKHPQFAGWSDNYCCDNSFYNETEGTGCGYTQLDCSYLGIV